MPTTKVYNMAGEVISEIALSEAVFGIEPNVAAMGWGLPLHYPAWWQFCPFPYPWLLL